MSILEFFDDKGHSSHQRGLEDYMAPHRQTVD